MSMAEDELELYNSGQEDLLDANFWGNFFGVTEGLNNLPSTVNFYEDGSRGVIQSDGSEVFGNYVQDGVEYDAWGNPTGRNLSDVVGSENMSGPGSGSGSGTGSNLGQTAKDAINGLGKWAQDNKVLAGLLGTGLLSALKGNNSPDYAAAIKEKEQVDLRTRQRISDSITGMRPITVQRPGLLQTMSGQNVYDQNGRIAR